MSADLLVYDLAFDHKGPLVAGSLLQARVTVENIGDEAFSPELGDLDQTAFGLSLNSSISRFDYELASVFGELGFIPAGATRTLVASFQLPGDLPDGEYFLGAIANVEFAGDEAAFGNNDTAGLAITVGDGGSSVVERETGAGRPIVATQGNDVLNGSTAADFLSGLGGNDTLIGADGNDVLFGGDGDDTVRGGLGDDIIDGEAGADKLFGDRGADQIDGGAGNDRILGGNLNDILNGDGGADTIQGDAGADTLNGGAENDRLYGGSGDDALNGGDGLDMLDGCGGMDSYVGGAGYDRLYARLDGVQDTFIFMPGTGSDRVFRYEENTDRIGLSADFGFTNGADAIANMNTAIINASGHAILSLNGTDVIQLINFTITNPGSTINDVADDIFIL
ncbi:MAG: calcium-binding protein [Nitratireductor sp.]